MAFGAGAYFGRSTKQDVVISSSTSGASYGGGFKAEGEAAGGSKAAAATGRIKSVAGPAPTNVVVVKDGESIQAAVKAAPAGTIVRVMPGTYHETVYIDKDNIRIIGVIEEGRRAVLDGQKKLNDAILYSGNNFVVENLEIRNYKGNGIMGQAGNNFEIRNNVVVDTGVYGIFPQLGQNGIVEHNVVSGIADAAIYVGMSDNIHVAHNDVFDSVAGIEIENSRHCIVENNYVHNNTGGLLAFVTPGPADQDHLRRDHPQQLHRREQPRQLRRAGLHGRRHSRGHRHAGHGRRRRGDRGQHHLGQQGRGHHHHRSRQRGEHHRRPRVRAELRPREHPRQRDAQERLRHHPGSQGADAHRGQARRRARHRARGARVPAAASSTATSTSRRASATLPSATFTNTAATSNYLLPPVPPREIEPDERGKVVFLGICSGCHIYNGRMIGPPVQVIQALYMDNPQGIADYIAKPVKKRDDYPEMPPQDYLDPETRLAVAKYMLQVTN